MLAIIMSVCLQADPAQCRQEKIELNGTPFSCIIQAPPIIAEWGFDHPEWTVKSWKCGGACEVDAC